MACFELSPSSPFGSARLSGGYATEAECLQACKEGACCESNGTCSVKPQCQCQGAGKTFQGVGTVCTPNPCLPCKQFCDGAGLPKSMSLEFTGFGSGLQSWVANQLQETSWSITTNEQSCGTYTGVYGHDWSSTACFHTACFAGRCPKVLANVFFTPTQIFVTVRVSAINPCDNGYSWNSIRFSLPTSPLLCQGGSISLDLTPASYTGGVIAEDAGRASIKISVNPLP